MSDIPLSLLIAALVLLIVLSGFFSGSETGLMTLNRYRLRHLVKNGHRGAQRANRLLQRPDRLIGLILLGNNFVNILASSLTTVIAWRIAGEAGIAAGAAVLTLVILIFSEVTPKTLAALHPERVAFPAAWVYQGLIKVLYPLVWLVNLLANGLLRLLRVSPLEDQGQALSSEELRTVVMEAGAMLPRRHRNMLLGIMDLEKVVVQDIMVPRTEIVGLNLDEDWDVLVARITSSEYTRMPVYREHVDHVIGVLHVRNVIPLLARDRLDRERLEDALRPPYFVPENTPLNKQLLNFQRENQRMGLVVDEYGDIQGLVTLEDILEEIVGEFTTDPAARLKHVVPQADGSYLVDGSTSVRTLNRIMGWHLPTGGARTLNGLILEHLESIPQPGTSILLGQHPVEIVQTKSHAVRTVRVQSPLQETRTRRRGASRTP